jgi:cysteine synthase A
LVPVRSASAATGVEILGKLESRNPGGSVKDRIGIAMVNAAEADGTIAPGRTTIVEATSGNTGIALAFVAAAKGYEIVLVLPQGMSRERETLLRLFGARVEIVESMGGMNEAVATAHDMAKGKDFWLPDQFSNPANPQAHYETTGPEIWADTGGKIDALVCGVGTGGTITGAGRFLKEQNPDIRIVAVEPASSPVLSGGKPGPHRIQGIGAGFVPAVLDRELIDEVIQVSDDDAIEAAWSAARGDGLLIGMSCGAALVGARTIARSSEGKLGRVVAVLPDSGERYSSAAYFQPPPAQTGSRLG